jgi:hypothetical protein
MTSPQQHINARAIRARRLALLADIALGGMLVLAGSAVVIVATELLFLALTP